MTWLYRDHPLATSNPAVQTMQHSRSKQISAPSQPHTGHVGWSCDIITQFHVQHTLLYSTDNLTADFSSTIKSVLCFLTQGSRMLKCNSNYWLRQIFFLIWEIYLHSSIPLQFSSETWTFRLAKSVLPKAYHPTLEETQTAIFVSESVMLAVKLLQNRYLLRYGFRFLKVCK